MTETFVTLLIAIIAAIIYARLHKDSREFTKLMTALVIGMIVGIAAFNIGLSIKKATIKKSSTTQVTSLYSTNNLLVSPFVLSVTNNKVYCLSKKEDNEIDHFIIFNNKLVARSINLWRPTYNHSPDIINDS